MTYSIGNDNPERAARLAAEQKLADMTSTYHRLLIQTSIDDAVRNSGGLPLLVTPQILSNAQVTTGQDGKPKVLIVTDSGTLTPAQAVAALKTHPDYAFLWDGAPSNDAIDLSNLDSTTYRAQRAVDKSKFGLGKGRFSNGR
jgi:phage/plasmid primase-like uncharacterized protein